MEAFLEEVVVLEAEDDSPMPSCQLYLHLDDALEPLIGDGCFYLVELAIDQLFKNEMKLDFFIYSMIMIKYFRFRILSFI